MTHEDDLRGWAKSSLATEAGTELLLRGFAGRFATLDNPWVYGRVKKSPTYTEGAWIDFENLGDHAIYGAYAPEERRFLLVAASLVSDTDVVLSDAIQGLDRVHLDLVLAAIAHAGGSHQHSEARANGDGNAVLRPEYLDSLHQWPRSLRAV